jgi:hypothetical protein
MSIAAVAISEAPVAAQVSTTTTTGGGNGPPPKRTVVATSDVVATPEPR